MRLDDKATCPDNSVSDVLRLCDSYRLFNDIRIDLDRRMLALPDDDRLRDVLWQEVEANLAQRFDLIARLATTSSVQPADVRAKASILAMLLRGGNANPTELASETVALALSLADEVALV